MRIEHAFRNVCSTCELSNELSVVTSDNFWSEGHRKYRMLFTQNAHTKNKTK